MEKIWILWTLFTLGGCRSQWQTTDTPKVDIQQLTHSEWVLQKEIIFSDACTSQPIAEETDSTEKRPTYYRLYNDGRFEIGRIDTTSVKPPPTVVICRGWWSLTENNQLLFQFAEGDRFTTEISLQKNELQLQRHFITDEGDKAIFRQVFFKNAGFTQKESCEK